MSEETSAATAEAEAPKLSSEDAAAHDYQVLLPALHKKIEELSNRQLKNVVTAWFEVPLARQFVNFSYTQEKELFEIGSRILDCRFVLLKAVLDMKQEEIKKLLEETSGIEKEKSDGEKLAE